MGAPTLCRRVLIVRSTLSDDTGQAWEPPRFAAAASGEGAEKRTRDVHGRDDGSCLTTVDVEGKQRQHRNNGGGPGSLQPSRAGGEEGMCQLVGFALSDDTALEVDPVL